MDDYKWSTNELIINELAVADKDDVCKHPGGRKPRKMTSSWMMHDRPLPPPRKTKYVIFIDDPDGHTLCRCDSIESGYEFLEKYRKETGVRCVLRPHMIAEEDMQQEERNRRQRARWDRGFGA